jgi:hypothetical protein
VNLHHAASRSVRAQRFQSVVGVFHAFDIVHGVANGCPLITGQVAASGGKEGSDLISSYVTDADNVGHAHELQNNRGGLS